jgi:Polyketide cyclase / dehydrase and lipid transport
MAKAFIILGIALGAVLVAIIILSLVAPKRISIRSVQFIQAPKEVVYDQLRFMKNFPNWSPFKVQDPEQKHVISGPDGSVGATFSWEGVKEKSKGYQKVVALKENERVELRCEITVPFESHPSFNYDLIEKAGGVEVVQEFDVAMPFPANVFGLLFGLKREIGATNQQGLALLKKVCE